MLQVLDPGFFTTVQDLGRPGWQQFGVSVGGAMDPYALQAANALVGNAPEEAGLEITLAGPRLLALERCLIAVTGGQFDLAVNETRMPLDTALFVRAGSIVEFGPRRSGARAWLALAGGIDVPLILGSRSTDARGGFGGWEGRALRPGDRLAPRVPALRYERAGRALPASLRSRPDARIRVVWGPHDEYFSDAARHAFTAVRWTVGEQSDRMGLRLRGEQIERAAGELLSCGVIPGAIQVPADGQPIVLMADGQPTGGYPVLATVIQADLPLLAQKLAGDTIAFTAADLASARAAR